jgi:nucleoside-diphosphate kinase
VNEFRDYCGPPDPSLAKQIRPNSLRAKFGKDKVQNAIHCTDLVEDGVLEVSFTNCRANISLRFYNKLF